MTGTIELAGLTSRTLTPQDLDMICVHRQNMFLEAGGDPEQLKIMTAYFRPWLQPRLADGRYYGFALLDADCPIAAIGLMSIDWPPHPSHPTEDQRGYVLNVFVEPSHRRRGLASALMQLADAEFKRRAVSFAILHATEVGKAVYQQLGWRGTAQMAKIIG